MFGNHTASNNFNLFFRLCGELGYIPLITKAKENKESLKTVQKDLNQLQTKAAQLCQDRTSRLAGLDNMEKQLVAAVNEHRADLDAWLDDLQEQSIKDIRQHKAALADRYKSEVAVCDTIKTEMAHLQKKLDTASKDEALMFSRLKQGVEQIVDKSHLISDIVGSEVTDKAQFVPHTKLEQQVKSLHGLGELVTDPQISRNKTQGVGKVKRSRGQGLGSQPLPMSQPYTVKSKTSFSVRVGQDKKTCNIRGMCQMADGSIVVADYNNRSLKLLDSTYKVSSHCCLTGIPFDVCPTEAGQVAVALRDMTIQLVYVGATMTTTRSFSTDHMCHSLAYSNSCLYVVKRYSTTIHVYNLTGTRLRTITTDQHGTQLFSGTFCITASRDGARLYITENTGLVTVDTEGNLLARFTSPDLVGGGYAVCVDRADNVFVGGCSSANVLQVEKGEMQVAKVVSTSDGIQPETLCFDGVSLRLLVSENGSDTVHVLHLLK